MIDEPTFLTLHDSSSGLFLGRDTALSVGRDTLVALPGRDTAVVFPEPSDLVLVDRATTLSLFDPVASLAIAEAETALEAERELLLTLDG